MAEIAFAESQSADPAERSIARRVARVLQGRRLGEKLRSQQIMDAPIAEAPTHVGDFHDLLAQFHSGLIDLWWVTVAIAGEPHKTARAAFGQVVFADHDLDRLAPGLWG